MSDDVYALGIDLGGTKIEIGVVDSRGKILDYLKFPTEAHRGSDKIIDTILEKASELMNRFPKKITSTGAGIAGQICPKGEHILFAPNLKWVDIPFKKILQSSLGIPCTLVNDVRAATWGEWFHGAGKGCSDFICLFLGTGLGGGIVSGERLINGFSNSAGELGHTTLREGGRQCSCGNRGCLEAYVSGWAIALSLQEAASTFPEKAAHLLSLAERSSSKLKAEHLSAAVVHEDLLALEVYSQVVNSLAHGCVSFVNGFNPQRLIFGGSVVLGFPNLLKEVENEIKRLALKAATAQLEIVQAQLGNDAVVIGAATAALKN